MTAGVLLDSSSSLEALTEAAEALYATLANGRPLDGDSIALPDGLAISPADAASCTKDPIRTAILLRAVNAALLDALERFGTIDVVYAGTGPLAPLVIPLLPRFENAPVHFTFIDVHEASVASARTLARGAGIDFVVADATTYRHPRPIHVAITETMQRALTREPQVAIVRNLAEQLVAGGILVPESIRVDLVIGDFVHPLLDLRADDTSLPAVRVEMPEQTATPLYRTTIVGYGEHVIEPYQSGLTHPEMAWDLAAIAPGTWVEFRYETGTHPRITCLV